jgi:hypothetical protein
MSPSVLKGIGIACFVLAAILLFVAWERYQDNASQVEAANKMMQSSPLGGMMKEMTGGAKREPGMPTATKIGGVVCLVVAAKKSPGGIPPETPRTP